LVRLARVSLGLDDVASFDPAKKIVEYAVAPPRPLAAMSVSDLLDEVSSTRPTPGGGSVSALAGALSAALAAMVASLTHDQKGSEPRWDLLRRVGLEAQGIKERLLAAVDADAAAFDRLIEASRLPKVTEADRKARDSAIQSATAGAIEIPLAVMTDSVRAMELSGEMLTAGMQSALSDAGVAVLMAAAAVEGGYYNVRINLSGLVDLSSRAALRGRADDLLARAESLRGSLVPALRKRLGADGA
jgi:glutamate formiminotransferase/formiminotetrahydrofolate cyclodeaminase